MIIVVFLRKSKETWNERKINEVFKRCVSVRETDTFVFTGIHKS